MINDKTCYFSIRKLLWSNFYQENLKLLYTRTISDLYAPDILLRTRKIIDHYIAFWEMEITFMDQWIIMTKEHMKKTKWRVVLSPSWTRHSNMLNKVIVRIGVVGTFMGNERVYVVNHFLRGKIKKKQLVHRV